MPKYFKAILLCISLFTVFSSSASIYGTLGACVGSTSVLVDSVSGSMGVGTWSSSDVSIATVGVTSGVVTGVAPGTAIITLTNSVGVYTAIFTVSIPPGPIVGGGTPFCSGTSITLSNSVSGGYWSRHHSYASGVIVDSFSGLVTGTGFHSDAYHIRYTTGLGCYTTVIVTVNGAPYIDTIMGTSDVFCLGTTQTLTTTLPGGTWSSSNPSAISITSTGVATSHALDSASITYSLMGSCGLVGHYTRRYYVTDTTAYSPIYGPTSVATLHTINLTNPRPGGTWSSSNPSVAMVGTSGIVSGITAGTVVISYSRSGCGPVAHATTTINVLSDCISGDVFFSSGASMPYYLTAYLIKYNPSTLILSAVDSARISYSMVSAGVAHYFFCNVGADSFRVKIAYDTIFPSSSTTYLPTYHNASAFWNTANVINHSLGVHDFNKNINMAFGAYIPGPGFIGGSVTSGANKGTADGDPVPGLLVVCVNDATGAVVQHTYTDTTGAYEFTNLALGTYRIHPEFINYATVEYPAVTLTGTSTSMTAASFRKNTLSKTITPILVSVKEVSSPDNVTISAYPNPAHDKFTLAIDGSITANALISLTDITGKTLKNITTTGNITTVDVAELPTGMYLLKYTDGTNSKTVKITKH